MFWLAVLTAGALSVFRPDPVPADDVSRFLEASSQKAYLAGRIDSEIEVRDNDFGGEALSFVLSAKKFWKDSSEEGRPVSGRVRVSMPAQDLRYGDVIALSGELRRPRGLRNPGGFNERAWLARQGIRSSLYVDKNDRFKILERGKGNPALAWILRLKQSCIERLRRDYPERDAAILSALFFGVRSDIDDAVKDRFLKTGTTHLLAVSGFNVGFVIAAVLFLLKPFHVRRPIRLALGLAAAWFYVCLVGPQSPVFRAGVMATVWLTGEIFGRRSDPLNSLGLSALILWAIRPLELFDPGFQLSYAAVVGIVVAVPHLVKRPELFPNEKLTLLEKTAHQTNLLFWTSFAAQAATLPIVLAHFYVVTPWSVFANVPAAFLVLVIFMAGAVQMIVSPVMFAGPALAWAVQRLMDAFLGILGGFERLPMALWAAGKLAWPLWLILASAVLIFIVSTRRSAWVRAAAMVAIVVLCFSVQETWRRMDRSFRATFLDVGQGDAIHLRFPDGTNWLVDAGGGRAPDMGRMAVLPYLRHEGVRRLDSMLVTHPQEDHLGGFASILQEIPVAEYVDPGAAYDSIRYKRLIKELKRRHVPIVNVQTGEEAEYADRITMTVLSAGLPPGSNNINDASVVLRFVHPAGTMVLTGDAGEAAFARINASGSKITADVLKIPHHGAKPGPETRAFLAEAAPKIAVISAGERNRYGHPSKEMLGALESLPSGRIHRTDRSGAGRAVFDRAGMRFLDGPEAFA